MPTKEHPIIFSAPMVRAILDGSKTVTRRVVKPQPERSGDGVLMWGASHRGMRFGVEGMDVPPGVLVRCPYGQPGDRLWVREAWRIGAWNEDNQQIAVDYIDGPDKAWRQVPLTPEGQELFDRLWIQSSDECRRKGVRPDADGNYRWAPGESPLRWRPSIHMPRWASRITLEITGVRVQRLQDISTEDALAEGVNVHPDFHGKPASSIYSPLQAFRDLWEVINGPDSWDENPWVWAISFRRVS